MNRHTCQDIEWLTFDLLDEAKVKHAVFTNKSGFNLAYHTAPEVVSKHFNKVKEIFNLEKLISGNQIHEDTIASVNKSSQERIMDVDGLMTNESSLALLTSHADCQGALFYDPIKKVIANTHSGWRGSTKNILGKTVKKMKSEYGTSPSDIIVCITPSLSPKNAEFKSYQEIFPKEFWAFQVKPNYFNFWEISKWQLKNEGILEDHIEVAGICTYENRKFFSYRRQQQEGPGGPLVAGNATFITI